MNLQEYRENWNENLRDSRFLVESRSQGQLGGQEEQLEECGVVFFEEVLRNMVSSQRDKQKDDKTLCLTAAGNHSLTLHMVVI